MSIQEPSNDSENNINKGGGAPAVFLQYRKERLGLWGIFCSTCDLGTVGEYCR